MLVRQCGEVVIVVPFHGAAEQAASEDRLNAWVGQQLQAPMPDAPIHTSSKVATAEAIRLQASRERFEQRKRILELQREIALISKRPTKAEKYKEQPAITPAPVGEGEDPIAALRASREADAGRRLDAAVQQASADMAGEPTPTLPQA